MKIVLGIFCLLLCVFLGYVFALTYTDKRRFYENFLSFNKKIINEVSFSLNTFPKIVDSVKEDDSFIGLARIYLSQKEFDCNYKYLTIDEKQFVKGYFDMLGKSDKDSQINYFSTISNEIECKLAYSREEEKKYKSLYIKTGFLLGLIALIIFL